MNTACRALLPDGRWHFQHGPIDLVIGAEGEADSVAVAHEAAWHRFEPVLAGLVSELTKLRMPCAPGPCPLHGPVAARMWQACAPHGAAAFITPMAAVAGSVAEEIVACYARPGVRRAWVNNGGDIALFLTPGQSVRIGLWADLGRFDADQAEAMAQGALALDGGFRVAHAMPVRGIATSGWRGRSHSRGIADSVTVLARSAACADACATMVANAVDVPDSRIVRRPARSLRDDSDLGDIAVTVEVPTLAAVDVRSALAAGLRAAQALRAAGMLWAAQLVCQGQLAWTGPPHAAVQLAPAGPALGVHPDSRRTELGSVFA